MKRTADQVAQFCKELEQEISISNLFKNKNEEYIGFNFESSLPPEILQEMFEDKWWAKIEDRTYYIINCNKNRVGFIAILNDLSEEETNKLLNTFYEYPI